MGKFENNMEIEGKKISNTEKFVEVHLEKEWGTPCIHSKGI